MTRLVDTFEREEFWWSKDLPCAFWGGESLPIHIDIETWESGPTVAQERILDGLLARTQDFRPYLEKQLFEHYQNKIYGYATGGDEITPPIKEPSEIWPLITGPLLWIRYVADEDWDQSIRFVISFACHWDEEHGLDIEVVDWRIVDFGAD